MSMKNIEYMIEHDPMLANSMIEDNNNISLLIKCGYYIETIQLGMMIMTICFTLGMMWHLYCDITTAIALS